jgi:probable HAF family extracellular repeat protein
VGEMTDADGRPHAFLYRSARMYELVGLPGADMTFAFDINSAGTVCGSSGYRRGSVTIWPARPTRH